MRVRSRIIGLALLAGAATGFPVRADECPRQENALAGYVVDIGSGRRFSVTSDSSPYVVSTMFEGEQRVQREQLYQGYFPLEVASPRGTLFRKPGESLREFFPIADGKTAKFEVRPEFNGNIGKPQMIELKALNQTDVDVGGCTYRVWRIARKTRDEDGKLITDVVDYYSPDLRCVLGREIHKEDGGISTQIYKNIRPRGRSDLL